MMALHKDIFPAMLLARDTVGLDPDSSRFDAGGSD
jgi:hypothetical protein